MLAEAYHIKPEVNYTMTDEKQPNETKPTEPTPTETNPLDKFGEIKERYENELTEKDKEIEELKKQLAEKEGEVDSTISNLNDEVNEKLAQAEKIKNLQETVDNLVKERAETTVDNYIQKGIILPSQRESAVKLCLSDNDTFLDLYRDAKPIVETQQKRKSVPQGTAERIANYFKN